MTNPADGILRTHQTDQPTRTPFLAESSFTVEQSEAVQIQELSTPSLRPDSPFQSIYEMEGQDQLPAPEAEEFVEFMADLYDEDFNDAVLDIANEATDFVLNQAGADFGGEWRREADIQRLLEEHFDPLLREVDKTFDQIAVAFERVDLEVLSENEFDRLLEELAPDEEDFSPSVENLFGGAWKRIKKKAKKAAKKAWRRTKSAAKGLGRLALAAVWKKLKKVAKQMLKEVLKRGMEKIPPEYRGLAETVARNLGLQSEIDPQELLEETEDATEDFAAIQRNFDAQIASLVLETDEREQDKILAQYVVASERQLEDPIGDLRRARAKFISRIGQLEGEDDPGPAVEEFVQAVLTAAKWAIRIIGKPRTKQFLGKQIAKLVRRWMNKKKARSLGRVIADVGVEIIMATGKGEVAAEFEETLGGSAIAQVVEDTAHQLSSLPAHVLENEEFLEGYLIEAFENAAAANLPNVLPENVYKKRPELRESCKGNGVWMAMPSKFYKTYSRVFDTTICPHAAQILTSFGAVPLATILRDHYGLSFGGGIKARVHLYEAMMGCRLFHIGKYERDIRGFASSPRIAWSQIHPLSTTAASLLTGEPCLGRNVASRYLNHPGMINSNGQRFYYLEIEGAQPQTTITPEGTRSLRRSTELNVTMRFHHDQVQLFLFLSEADSQEIAVKLRQDAPIGSALRTVMSTISAGLSRIFTSCMYRHVKIVHPAMVPGSGDSWALKRLGPVVTDKLVEKIMEWAGETLSSYIKSQRQEVIAAANDEMDGVTLVVTMNNAPGLPIIRELLTGGGVALRGPWFPDGTPDVKIMMYPGFRRG